MDPATFMGLHGFVYLRRSVGIWLLGPGLHIFHLDQQQLGRSVGHMLSPPPVGHPDLQIGPCRWYTYDYEDNNNRCLGKCIIYVLVLENYPN
jgi:hypothetical protein